MSNVMMIHLNDGRTVIGYEIDTDDEHGTLLMAWPVVLQFEYPGQVNTAVYGSQYSPFSEHGEVLFHAQGIQATSEPDVRVARFYGELVKYYQSLKVNIQPAGKVADSENTNDEEPTEEELEQFLNELEEIVNESEEEVKKELDKSGENVVPLRKKNGTTVH